MVELRQIAAADQSGGGDLRYIRLAGRGMEHGMTATAIEIVHLAEQPLIAQAGDLLMARHDGDLQLTGQHAAFELARGQHLQRQLDGIVAAIEALDRRGDRELGMGDDTVWHADGQRPAQLLAARCDMGLEAVEGSEELAGRAVDASPSAVRRKPPRPLAQPQAEAGLEIMHMGADRRLRDIEQRLRGSKAATFRDSGEHAQKTQIGIAHLSKHRLTDHSVKQLPKRLHRLGRLSDRRSMLWRIAMAPAAMAGHCREIRQQGLDDPWPKPPRLRSLPASASGR